MNKLSCASLLCLLSLACAADPEPDTKQVDASECVTRGAVYYVEYFELDGDCGPLPDNTIVVPRDGKLTVSADCDDRGWSEGCSVFVDRTCRDETPSGADFVLTVTGQVGWADDGSGAVGVETIKMVAEDGSSCLSTYRVEFTRI